MSFSRLVRREAGTYVSWCPELDVRSEGRTVEKALVNLDEAVEQFLVLHPQLREHRDAQLLLNSR